MKRFLLSVLVSITTLSMAEARLPLGAGTDFKTRIYAATTLKMATVGGGALITNVSGSIPFNQFLNRAITISDGAKTVTGYIKDVGTGETYGTDVVSNGDFTTDTTGWAPSNATLTSVAGGQDGNCLQLTVTGSTQQFAWQALATAAGKLYRVSGWVKSGTSGNEEYRFIVRNPADTGVTASKTGTSPVSWTADQLYFTGSGAPHKLRLAKNTATAGTMFFDTASGAPVLTPDSTGVTITSTRGGLVQSWASNSGINANAASFTVTISE